MKDKEYKQSEKSLPKPVRWCSKIIGGGSLVYFVLFLLAGTRVSVYTVLSETRALLLDTGLCMLFFCQHSVMVRRGFKQRILKIVPETWHGALFSIASGVTLIFVLAFWQGTGPAYPAIPLWRMIVMGCFVFLAGAGFYWGSRSLPGFDPFGVRVRRHLVDQKPTLQYEGPYKYTRHPLYFFALVLIWGSTTFTPDRLLFNLLWTIWIFSGTCLEEMDLVRLFGKDYREYQKKVPMILPVQFRK